MNDTGGSVEITNWKTIIHGGAEIVRETVTSSL